MTNRFLKTGIAVLMPVALVLALLLFAPATASAEESGGFDSPDTNQDSDTSDAIDGFSGFDSSSSFDTGFTSDTSISTNPPSESEMPISDSNISHSNETTLASSDMEENLDVNLENHEIVAEIKTGSNSYAPEISSERVISIDNADVLPITIKITEMDTLNPGQTLGSVQITIPEGFSVSSFNPATDLSVSNTDKDWSGDFDTTSQILSLWARENPEPESSNGESNGDDLLHNFKANYLVKHEWLTITLLATATPTTPGVYTFVTQAWTEANDTYDGVYNGTENKTNNRADGYNDPTIAVFTGLGKVDEPYQVSSAGLLDHVRYRRDAHYIQTTDIDLNVAPYNTGKGWMPIGTNSGPFSGSYDGGLYKITNLSINDPDLSYAGLFSHLNFGATLQNITLTNANITCNGGHVGGLAGENSGIIKDCSFGGQIFSSGDYLGGLVGWNNGSITSCEVIVAIHGSISTSRYVGGLVGYNTADGYIADCAVYSNDIRGLKNVGGVVGMMFGKIEDCTFNSTIDPSIQAGENVGGLIGYAFGAEVFNCHTVAFVTATSGLDKYGGLIGYAESSTIQGCTSSGTVKDAGDYSSSSMGGLIGYADKVGITDCHSSADVYGRAFIGGLVGQILGHSVSDCSATGTLSGYSHVGGLVGHVNSGTNYDVKTSISNCFATGNVQVYTYSSGGGGLVGENEGGTITYCYATGDVSGGEELGGLVGWNRGGSISNCYATGNVNGTGIGLGGLVGLNQALPDGTEPFYISYCYAAGVVTGTGIHATKIGGLIGDNLVTNDNTIASYYDSTKTARNDSGAGIGRTTSQMQDIATFVGWSISLLDPEAVPTTVWYIEQGSDYPMLWWQYEVTTDDPPSDDPPSDDPPSDDPPSDDPPSVEPPPGGPSSDTTSDGSSEPSTGPTAQPSGLIFSSAGGSPVISADLISSGTAVDLAEAQALYQAMLEAFEQNLASMTAAEYAVAVIELAVARAAIMVMEARLSGDPAALAAAIEAYQFAQQQLAAHGSYLDGEQSAVVESLMSAIDSVITALGG